jgi:hypothetical protein
MLVCPQRSVFRPKGSHPSPPEAPDKDVERSPVDEGILTALAEFPFSLSSVRELSRRICPPSFSVHRAPCIMHRHWHRHRHLMQSLRFKVRHLRWVPNFDGGTEQKQIRVQMEIELLQILSVQSKACASGTTLSPWMSGGFICSVSISKHDLMWTAHFL